MDKNVRGVRGLIFLLILVGGLLTPLVKTRR